MSCYTEEEMEAERLYEDAMDAAYEAGNLCQDCGLSHEAEYLVQCIHCEKYICLDCWFITGPENSCGECIVHMTEPKVVHDSVTLCNKHKREAKRNLHVIARCVVCEFATRVEELEGEIKIRDRHDLNENKRLREALENEREHTKLAVAAVYGFIDEMHFREGRHAVQKILRAVDVDEVLAVLKEQP